MNSRQYEKQQLENLNQVLKEHGIDDYKATVLSADRTEYEITLSDSTVVKIPSGYEYFED